MLRITKERVAVSVSVYESFHRGDTGNSCLVGGVGCVAMTIDLGKRLPINFMTQATLSPFVWFEVSSLYALFLFVTHSRQSQNCTIALTITLYHCMEAKEICNLYCIFHLCRSRLERN